MQKVNQLPKKYTAALVVLASLLLSLLIVHSFRSSFPDTIQTEYADDLTMPGTRTISMLDKAVFWAVNSTLNRKTMEVTYKFTDAQLFSELKHRQEIAVRSVEVQLKKGFPYDVYCTLYYPDETGAYTEDCKAAFLLRKYKKKIFFSLPDDVDYGMRRLRLDIDADYTIEEFIVSEDPIHDYYTPEAASTVGVVLGFLSFFICMTAVLGIVFYALRQALGYWRTGREKCIRFVGTVAATGVLCGGLSYVLSIFMGQSLSRSWLLMMCVIGALMGVQVFRLLYGTVAAGRKRRLPMSAAMKSRVRLFWAILLIFEFLIVFEWYDSTGGPVTEIRFLLPMLLASAETLLLGLLYRKYVLLPAEDEVSFYKVYLYLIFILGVAYMVVFFPYISPDETSHFWSSYRMSDLMLGLPGHLGDNRLIMRMEDYNLCIHRGGVMSPRYYQYLVENFHFLSHENDYMVIDAPMVTNAIFSYFTTGFGLCVGRILHLSGELTFVVGRFFNVLAFYFVMMYMMKKIPFGRTALFSIAMLPMTLHIAGSYSYDVSTFCFVILFVTEVMVMICSREKVTRREYLLCILYGILMAPSKVMYVPLLFMILLVPDRNLGDSRREAVQKKLLVIFTGIASIMIIMYLVNRFAANPALREMAEENASVNMLSWTNEEGYTFSWILNHPVSYVLMCVRTVVELIDYYFRTLLGASLGWLDINLPGVYVVVSFVALILSVNISDEVSEHIHISRRKKAWIWFLSACTFMITLLAMTLNWTPLSYDYITGVQGRYFIPLLVPGIWLIRSDMIHVGTAIRKRMVLVLGALNIWILVYVFTKCVVFVPKIKG